MGVLGLAVAAESCLAAEELDGGPMGFEVTVALDDLIAVARVAGSAGGLSFNPSSNPNHLRASVFTGLSVR